ncbi:probable inactive tRNA-specific adenosine deaminase-like protein 3 [Diaphorina citri]|jgi:Cytosine/adenosine deaminases|uniref:Probable inactive tRNA-specific adenosine deaminase-like protein 3 n=1 Tax=Diaphorina citri TaxID=121845 RepID=A0A1S3DUE6_DIACI|nr:probable inactive tRNA-specific adenosine deaminase-like protein 3 [Diaphorina citri]
MCSEAKRKKMKLINERNWSLKAVLSDEFLGNIPMINVLVDKIKNKKYISSIISYMNQICPIPSLQHLKRVRGDEIIIGTRLLEKNIILEKLCKIEVFTLGLSLDPYLSLVPAKPPQTKAQFALCNSVWPCNFHPDKTLEKILSGENFTPESLSTIEAWMKKTLELCQYSGVCCSIVSPETNKLIAFGKCETSSHPMKHAAMVAIDNVAKTQSGGAWLERGDDWRKSDNRNDQLKTEKGLYLCTGYDVYLTMEPCLMCAMALVHSRAKTIFYGCSNDIDGALGSKLKLHNVSNLNHHYQVYAGVLEFECRQASYNST